MTILVIADHAPQPDPELVRCTCGSYDVKVRTSMPGQESRIAYLHCQACDRSWKVRGRPFRALVIEPENNA